MISFKKFLTEMTHHEVIAALRSKTVARGATEPEAASAKAKADELETKYGKAPSSGIGDLLRKFDSKNHPMPTDADRAEYHKKRQDDWEKTQAFKDGHKTEKDWQAHNAKKNAPFHAARAAEREARAKAKADRKAKRDAKAGPSWLKKNR